MLALLKLLSALWLLLS